MIINKYNVKLTRLTAEDIEFLREKRNSVEIQQRMVYQETISKQDQQEWFKQIDNMHNLYLLIHYKGEVVGLVNGKNADFESGESEGGIFIWDEKYVKSILPGLCSIIMHDYNYGVCEFKKTFIKVLKNNEAAIKFNEAFGYEVIEDDPSKNYVTCELTSERYNERIKKYRGAIESMYKDYGELEVKNFSFNNVSDQEMDRLYSSLPQYLKDKLNLVLQHEGRTLLK